MNRRGGAGFTIIESVLFLAVSTALAVGILASSSAVVSQQRYKDATNRLQSFMQSQFVESSFVINSREDDWECSANGVRQLTDTDADGASRGTTDCYVLGKVLNFTGNGSQIESRNVIASGRPTADEELSIEDDSSAFKVYDITWTEAEQRVYELDWGASLATNTDRGVGAAVEEQYLFILKSPYSGSIRTFYYKPSEGTVRNSEGDPFRLESIESDNRELPDQLFDSFNPELTYCIVSPDLTVFQSIGLKISRSAASPSSIELIGDGSVC